MIKRLFTVLKKADDEKAVVFDGCEVRVQRRSDDYMLRFSVGADIQYHSFSRQELLALRTAIDEVVID